jgi:mannonate dehydratase
MILEVKNYIERHGLTWDVVESLPVSEAIKYAGNDRHTLIDNYNISLKNLGEAGIHTVCYNFMPVIDWIRTDLNYPQPDGTYTLFFNKIHFAYFDCYILNRPNADKDYSADEMAQVEKLAQTISKEEENQLVDTIIVKTQGFIHGNIQAGEQHPVPLFNKLLGLYKGIDKNQLRENLRFFLEQIMPTCEKYNVNMCIHPDDPPYPVLGLPRIVTSEDDIRWILQAVDTPYNGFTFCAGSLSSGAHNNVPDLARKFAQRTHFVHLRSTEVFDNGNFMEASHLSGRGHLIEVASIFQQLNPDVPMRVDHGKLMLDDLDKKYNPGYSFLGRMFALAQVDGILAATQYHLNRQAIHNSAQYSI